VEFGVTELSRSPLQLVGPQASPVTLSSLDICIITHLGVLNACAVLRTLSRSSQHLLPASHPRATLMILASIPPSVHLSNRLPTSLSQPSFITIQPLSSSRPRHPRSSTFFRSIPLPRHFQPLFLSGVSNFTSTSVSMLDRHCV